MSQSLHNLTRVGNEVVRLAPMAVLVCDEDMIIRMANQKAEELLTLTQPGQPTNENLLVNKSATETLPGLDLDQVDDSPRRETLLTNERRIGIELQCVLLNLDNKEWTIVYIREADQQRRREMLLEKEATTDELSGLANRRAFQRTMEGNQHRALSLAIVDIDYFKSVNDSHGHLVGDEVVKQTGRLMREVFSDDAILTARMGGDEFSVLFETSNTESILNLLDRFRTSVSDTKVPEHPNIELTVSIGLAISTAPRVGSRTLLTHADRQLYLAKGAGRNRVAHMTLNESDIAR